AGAGDPEKFDVDLLVFACPQGKPELGALRASDTPTSRPKVHHGCPCSWPHIDIAREGRGRIIKPTPHFTHMVKMTNC
ncbi:MAG: hypothetical protein J5807_02465, partial [Kiritimatiellae bacterium]|nr:hypothetical protein [Kiritimatiellia bacterium]